MTRPTKEQVDAALEAAGQYMQPPAQNFDDPVEALQAEVDKLRALKMLVLAYKRDFEENHTDAIASRYELFEALDD